MGKLQAIDGEFMKQMRRDKCESSLHLAESLTDHADLRAEVDNWITL